MTQHLRIGTRGSLLARTQSAWVERRLQAAHPGLTTELVIIKTSGDRIVDRPLSAVGGKGLFVKEIEEALLAGDIDCAVHSLKDMPAELAPSLVLAAVPEREDPRDVVLTRGGGLAALAPGAKVGTSSLRRSALVRLFWPHLAIVPLRGNVDTRIRKLELGEVDAVLLAGAGLHRMGIDYPHLGPVDPFDFIPAIGQGALAIESRQDATLALLQRIEHRPSRLAINAERAFLHRVGGSCVTPLAAYATVEGETVTLRALIAQPDGKRVVRGERSGPVAAGPQLGTELADDLLARGGAEILRELEASLGIR